MTRGVELRLARLVRRRPSQTSDAVGWEPNGWLGGPAEVASLTSFLCSEEATYLTGASMDINVGDLKI